MRNGTSTRSRVRRLCFVSLAYLGCACGEGFVEPVGQGSSRRAPSATPGWNQASPTGAAAGSAATAASGSPLAAAPGQSPATSAAGTPGVAVPGSTDAAYSMLPDGKGGINLEQVSYPASMHFDRALSLEAFKTTLYPLLRTNCAACHSTDTHAQAPIHSDVDVSLAHDYALTRVNFRKPAASKFVIRMGIDRHNCIGGNCKTANMQMLAAVEAWASAVLPGLPVTPRMVPEGQMVSEAEVVQWIGADKAKLAAADAEYIKYVSLHELHNAAVTADDLNVARVSVSKTLNSVARWAPKIANPTDINGKGLVYRFDIREYWGFNKGVKALVFGGSDDDIFFGDQTALLRHRFNFAATMSPDPAFAQAVWARVLEGSKEAYKQSGAAVNNKGMKPDYVEASQLVYTLSRPDVYNAIMALPVYAPELEKELGVIKDKDIASYQYMVIAEAITIDSRMLFRANTNTGGHYWKTFDIFTGNQQVFPFWEHPIPKYVSAAGASGKDLSLVATLLQPQSENEGGPGCNLQGSDSFRLCTNYTGESGVQQSASEIIWNLPNGLQGYAIYGGLNQRRTDAFSFIVHDPRRLRSASDKAINGGGFGQDLRLLQGASCMGCHIDGMNRANNDIRDRMDQGTMQATWVADAAVAEQVKQLYPTTSVMRSVVENDRRPFLDAMVQIRGGMILGEDKNVYVEPIAWAFEWAQQHYSYADTTAN